MKPVSLLIKPASSLCNLRCKYCFYHSVSEQRMTKSYGIMSENTLKTIVSQVFFEADGPVTLAFQGGEPTLAGLDFYLRLVELVDFYNTKKMPVQYALQTNGQVIDEKWAGFLARYKFLVGLSLDGSKDIHDMLRQDEVGRGSYNKVMRAVSLFRRHEVEFNILTVVSSSIARHAKKVYDFLKKNKFQYLQFIPCLVPFGADPADYEFALTAARYGDFLKTVFDLWYEDYKAGNYISIRTFDNLVRMAAGEPPELCGMSGRCTCQLVIEADGGVYPCDFYVTDDWLLGRAGEDTFARMCSSPKAQKFISMSQDLDQKCIECIWLPICRGGCRRDREQPGGGLGLNVFCPAYKQFYPYVWPRLQELAREYLLRSRRPG